MSFPRYEVYKDSGVEWLDEVPTHWALRRLKRVADVRLSNVDKHTVEGQESVSLCNYLDVYRNDRITGAIEFMQATAPAEQIDRLALRAGDCIITKDSEDPSDIGIPAYVEEIAPRLVCGYHLALMRPDNRQCIGLFLHYLFRSEFARATFEVASRGLTRYALGKYSIDNFEFALPPKPEQAAIAAFLDRETAKIDALVGSRRASSKMGS
jgi:type I restriction enzyme, S subunit